MSVAIDVDRGKVAALCRKHHIRELALFGSVLRDDFRDESDVDVLVNFAPGHVPGFIRLYDIEQELSQLLGSRKVDLVTRNSLHQRIRDSVLANIEVIYAEG